MLPQAQGHTQEDHQVSHQVVPQVDPRTIWRPPGHPPVVVDECVHNVRCEGNCEHVIGHNNTTHKPDELKVICHNCKQKFKDKVSMMDHKRDSDHPSKKKCNKFPDCEREGSCWYVHERPMGPQTNPQTSQENQSFSCNVCEQVFTTRNDLMFHKKRVHPSNIICSNFLNGYCRRGTSGEFCWYQHEQPPTAVQSVARPQTTLPAPGSTNWNTDFPVHPAMGQSSVVGLQKHMMGALQQQRQEQQLQHQQHQHQMAVLMNQLVNLNM